MFERRAGKLKLSAGFQADAGTVFLKADQGLAFADRLPAKRIKQALHNRADGGLAIIRKRLVAVFQEAEFLMLRPDTPVGFGLVAGFQMLNQLSFATDARCVFVNIGRWRRHSALSLPLFRHQCEISMTALIPKSKKRQIPKSLLISAFLRVSDRFQTFRPLHYPWLRLIFYQGHLSLCSGDLHD